MSLELQAPTFPSIGILSELINSPGRVRRDPGEFFNIDTGQRSETRNTTLDLIPLLWLYLKIFTWDHNYLETSIAQVIFNCSNAWYLIGEMVKFFIQRLMNGKG